MKKYTLIFLALIFLVSCEDENQVAKPEGNTYKVVVDQSGDFGNYNKSLIAVTPDINGQALKFNNAEKNQVTDNYLDNSELTNSKTTLTSLERSKEIEFNFIVTPSPVAPDTLAGPMNVKFTFYKDDNLIGERSFSYTGNSGVKQENLKFQ